MNRNPTAQSQNQASNRSINMAEIALRGMSTLVDIELAAARSLFQLQARSAALFGLPDYSELFDVTDRLIKSQLKAGTEQLVSCTRDFSQAISETHRQFNQVMKERTSQLTEDLRTSIEEAGQQTRQSIQELSDITQRQTEEVGRELEARSSSMNEAQNIPHNGQSESAKMQEATRRANQQRKQ